MIEQKTHIIAYGGSVICPTLNEVEKPEYSTEAIQNICDLFNENPNDKFIIIIGGGALARKVQNDKREEIQKFLKNSYNNGLGIKSENLDSKTENYLLDRIGILATLENAFQVKKRLSKLDLEGKIYNGILTEPYARFEEEDDSRIFLAGGHEPGASTDYVMMKYADNFDANRVHKISNFDIVRDVRADEFDKDKLDQYPTLKTATFPQIIGLVGRPEDFNPGDNTPLDPSAAKLGEKLANRIEGFTLNIGKMNELKNMVVGNQFYGTVVKNK